MNKFRSIFVGLLVLSTAHYNAYAFDASFSDGEAALDQQAQVVAQKPDWVKSEKRKMGLLKSIHIAKVGYRKWKKSHPNHSQALKDMRKTLKLISKRGTPEQEAIRQVAELCKNHASNCESALETNVKAIFGGNAVAIQNHEKSGLSSWLVQNAFAFDDSSSNTEVCNYDDTGMLFLGVYGNDRSCGVKYYGPGLGYRLHVVSVLTCTNGTSGVNTGIDATVVGAMGVGAGLLFGENGVCALLEVNIGFAAFAGLAVTNDFGVQ